MKSAGVCAVKNESFLLFHWFHYIRLRKSCSWLPVTWVQSTLSNDSRCCTLNLLGKFVTEETNVDLFYLNFLGQEQGLLPEKSWFLLQLCGAIIARASQNNGIILTVRLKWVLLKQKKRSENLDQCPARSAHTLARIYICSAFWLLLCTSGNCLVGFVLKETGKSNAPRVMKGCEEPACPRRLTLDTESKKSCLDLPGPY